MADHERISGDGTRLYVIGDIHGRADLLDQIVEKIGLDMRQNPAPACLTITLGDYIDRGPDCAGGPGSARPQSFSHGLCSA